VEKVISQTNLLSNVPSVVLINAVIAVIVTQRVKDALIHICIKVPASILVPVDQQSLLIKNHVLQQPQALLKVLIS
jgi:hypothetical protein